MDTIKTTFFQNSPIDINEIVKYNNGGFDKTRINVLIKATDTNNNTTDKEQVVNLYDINTLVKDPTTMTFSWMFINYGKPTIDMQLEILDSKKNVLLQSDTLSRGYTNTPTNISTSVVPKNFKVKELYYRVKLLCNADNWEEYYPSRHGVLFTFASDSSQLKEKTIYGDIRNDYDFLLNYLKDGVNIDQTILENMIDILTNPVDDKTFTVTDVNKKKYLTSSQYTSYAEENNFGMHDSKLEFPMDELNNHISNKYKLNSYINGKRVFHTDMHQQQKNDGLGTSYLQDHDIPTNSTIELETNKDSLINEEEFSCKYLLQTDEDVKNLYGDGITLYSGKIGSYHIPRDFSIFVKFRNSNYWKRVNPIRSNTTVNFLNERKYSITVVIQDNYIPVIGNEIMVMSNNLINNMYFRINEFNSMCEYYQVPCYFVPVSHVNESGEIVTEFMNDITNTEVYVNGYRLIPDVDFTLINICLHPQIPSIFLFKDMAAFGSKIDIVYLDEIENTYYFTNKLEDRLDNLAVLKIPDTLPPLIKGTFTVFANNKKISSDKIIVANSKTLIFNGINTRKNFMIKYHFTNNDTLQYLLDAYKKITTYQDSQTTLLGEDTYLANLVAENGIQTVSDVDNDTYLGVRYIYQLSTAYSYIKELFSKIKLSINSDLDCNSQDLFNTIKEKVVSVDITKNLPLYFNHNLHINCSRPYNEYRFEDNISIINPSRAYLLYKTADAHFDNNEDFDIDCNDTNVVEFLTYLNENIPIILPYVNNNILIDCNKTIKKENYIGLK